MDLNYGDFFGYDWQEEAWYRVGFFGAGGLLGTIDLPAADPASATRDAEDFNRRFALFVDRFGATRIPAYMKIQKLTRRHA